MSTLDGMTIILCMCNFNFKVHVKSTLDFCDGMTLILCTYNFNVRVPVMVYITIILYTCKFNVN